MVDTCVARVPVFADLSAEDQQRVAALARPAVLQAGEIAYSPHDAASPLVVVHTGQLKIVRTAIDGSEQIVRVLEPGEFAGETSMFTGRPPGDSAIAVEDTRLCVFRHDDLALLLRQHPDVGMRMLATVSARLSGTEERLNSLTWRDVESRVADYLLALPAEGGGTPATVRLPVAKKDVASLIDTSPESFSRALTRLTAHGLISVGPRRAITLLQPHRLRELADGR